MAQPELALAVWSEIRIWFPAQSDRIEADRELKGGMLLFLRAIDPGMLMRAWGRVKARPRVYASDSLPALLTQAIGDEIAAQIPGPETFAGWVRAELRSGSQRRIEAPSQLHQEAIDACGGWYDLGQASAKDLEWRLRPGMAVFEKAQEAERLRAVRDPRAALPARTTQPREES